LKRVRHRYYVWRNSTPSVVACQGVAGSFPDGWGRALEDQPDVAHWDTRRRAASTRGSPEVPVRIVGIDHIQLAMPPGGEATARQFYAGLLGVPEVPKPAELAQRGGVWFESALVKIHLGVEADFRQSQKAHPALLVEGLTDLAATLREAGYEVRDEPMTGRARIYVNDPFGNRLELIERL
jgi:catechol 2,3-dioxygenase-like lactoylglutathione lyase family enzyme